MCLVCEADQSREAPANEVVRGYITTILFLGCSHRCGYNEESFRQAGDGFSDTEGRAGGLKRSFTGRAIRRTDDSEEKAVPCHTPAWLRPIFHSGPSDPAGKPV